MSVTFEIASSSGAYGIVVGESLLDSLVREAGAATTILADAVFGNAPELGAAAGKIEVLACEDNKSLEEIAPLIVRMRELGVHRRSHLVAVGGGIIQDIATFLASIYMRGIRWTYAPTTLLAMVDSCVGGKSSINVAGYKNLVGNFYPPQQIVIDLAFLKSLGTQQIVDGLCEAVKICYARGEAEFDAYLADAGAIGTRLEADTAKRVIERSLKAKKWFIEIDEFDKAERLLLNFGHTFGHAIESASHFRISHGVAVGIGIMVAQAYALQNGMLSPRGVARVERLVAYIRGLLAELGDLPQDVRALDPDVVLQKFDSDKKHQAEHYRVVVPAEDGDLTLIGIPRDADGRGRVVAALRAAF
ncbi:3-dehydroquinate synthase [mine drainage metagenome]|uniref:3-dehydroquinate synthase n=1 Tax=mine drainage metagenome TaxID=410659 RepID=A0A1J5RX78_9ZZZZ